MPDYPVRPEVLRLKPYIPGKPIAEVQREYGVNEVIKLASNENPLGPSPLALQAIRQAAEQVHIYPEASSRDLRQALSAHVGLPEDWLMVGNGSDELLKLLAASYIRPGDKVVVPGCSFPNYRTVSEVFGAQVTEVPLVAETMDLQTMAAQAQGARLVFLCRPNNPTGGVFPEDAFRHFMTAVAPETLVVIDEAYHEFDETEFDSLGLLRSHENLIVTRTFSKAYGLAGLRVGYGMARPEIWQACYRVREPFSVNVPAQMAALAALQDGAHLDATVSNNKAGKAFLAHLCEELELPYVPSQANFVLIDLGRPAGPVYEALLRQGVIVRPMAGSGRPTCIRVTIGTPGEMERFAVALRVVLPS
ncbi:MAG TPA: histidinol-phosphate transaminase [Symbiobacteriaceae bacterium]|nr:histidinol-phosphate transaminase [Symbiobacteriaceae bacterium]